MPLRCAQKSTLQTNLGNRHTTEISKSLTRNTSQTLRRIFAESSQNARIRTQIVSKYSHKGALFMQIVTKSSQNLRRIFAESSQNLRITQAKISTTRCRALEMMQRKKHRLENSATQNLQICKIRDSSHSKPANMQN